MKIVVGLGNPGNQYIKTRHNAGFLALNYILGDDAQKCSSKFNAKVCETQIAGQKVLFVYPQTYMNNSGEAIKNLLNFYKLSAADILVLHDEVDLPLGTFKLVQNSGSAGHNGIKSIIEQLGTQDFKRIRIGIESRANKTELPTDVFVLQNFSEQELTELPLESIKNTVLNILQST